MAAPLSLAAAQVTKESRVRFLIGRPEAVSSGPPASAGMPGCRLEVVWDAEQERCLA